MQQRSMICTDNTEQVVQKINFSIFSIPKTFHDLKVVIKLKPRALRITIWNFYDACNLLFLMLICILEYAILL